MQYLDNGMIIVEDSRELRKIVTEKEIPLELIDIKASKLTHLNSLFEDMKEINGDISNWDVSNIESMESAFWNTKFNPDLSKWDLSSCTDTHKMFAFSDFNGDLSKWNVSKVKDMSGMFYTSMFNGHNGDISNWDLSNCLDVDYMFEKTRFDGDVSKWKFNKNVYGTEFIKHNDEFYKKYNISNNINFKYNNFYSIKDFIQWRNDNITLIINKNISNDELLEMDDYLNNFDNNKIALK